MAAANEQVPPMVSGDLRDRLGEHVEGIGGGVGPGVAQPQLYREQLGGVVAGQQNRRDAVGVLVGGTRAFPVAVRDHDPRVDVQHDDPGTDVPTGRLGHR
ncbi:hypothetical protein ABZ814_20000 [Micromonospora musae]